MRKYAHSLLFSAIASVFLSAAAAEAERIEVQMINATGNPIGTAVLTQLRHGVKIDVDIKSLPPGEHGFHFHQTGDCKGPDFKSAGGHLALKKEQHGFNFPKGPHAGDMPNLLVGSDGTARLQVINTSITLQKGPNSLLKSGGTALVIHAQPDDYKSQPSGNAGDRIACGEIKPGRS